MAAVEETMRVSRVGKRPVELPAGVSASVAASRTLTLKGPKGQLERTFHDEVVVQQDGQTLLVVASPGAKSFAQYQGLTRALINNMVKGVAEGYAISLDLYGVGYRATVAGHALTLNLGLSHPVDHTLHPNVTARVETIDEGGTKRPRLHLASHDKEALGQQAAQIRSYRPPEPYKGKGVRYTGEKIREKAGKAGG